MSHTHDTLAHVMGPAPDPDSRWVRVGGPPEDIVKAQEAAAGRPAALSPCPEAAAVSELLRRVGALEAEASLARRHIIAQRDSLQRAHDEIDVLRGLVRDLDDERITGGIREREAARRSRAALRAQVAAYMVGVRAHTHPAHPDTPPQYLANAAVAMADVLLEAAEAEGVEDVG